MALTRLAVLFGGISPEHEVSIITAVQLMKHVDRERYEVMPIYIDKSGQWWTGESLLDVNYFKTADLFHPSDLQSTAISPVKGRNPFDVALLCFHGLYGEAGNIQGLLELAGIPYQGPGVLSSAMCFDKVVLRQVLAAENIAQPDYMWFSAYSWATDRQRYLDQAAALNWPVFVKPANGGSTIGIVRAKTEAEFISAVEQVVQYDDRIIVEAEVKDCIEVNVSVLGYEGHTRASVPEQPIKADEFLSYADKYERGGGKKSGMASASRRIPAPISESLTKKVQAMAQHVFTTLDCSGVVRIDFMVNPSDESVIVIEPNTIPGSMSFYLWEASGLPYPQLIDELVKIAFARAKNESSFITSFESNILKMKKSL